MFFLHKSQIKCGQVLHLCISAKCMVVLCNVRTKVAINLNELIQLTNLQHFVHLCYLENILIKWAMTLNEMKCIMTSEAISNVNMCLELRLVSKIIISFNSN